MVQFVETSLTGYRLKVSEYGDDVETVSSVGELETLRRIFPRLPRAKAALLGPGDDAAIVAAPDGRFVVTTDMMIQGPDFRLAWSLPHELGWKAAASNLADVAAMGAKPTALVVAIAAPLDTPVTVLEGIADGLRDACALMAPDCGVVGGDLSTSSALTLVVTAFGDLEGRDAVLRSGARAGDDVAVAGLLGLAGAGVSLLYRDGCRDSDADGSREPDARLARNVRRDHPALVQAQVAPTSPIALGIVAALAGATAMLDVSDGLVLDASRIAAASGVTIAFSVELIEAEAETLRGIDAATGRRALDFVLSGGEDHALFATFPPGSVPEGFRVIGSVEAAGDIAVTIGGEAYLHSGGWDPYADWDGNSG